MPKGSGYKRGLSGTRAVASDVSRHGASGGSENPPVITKEAGTKASPYARKTGKKGDGQNNTQYGTSSTMGHDGVMGQRGGTRT